MYSYPYPSHNYYRHIASSNFRANQLYCHFSLCTVKYICFTWINKLISISFNVRNISSDQHRKKNRRKKLIKWKMECVIKERKKIGEVISTLLEANDIYMCIRRRFEHSDMNCRHKIWTSTVNNRISSKSNVSFFYEWPLP